MDDLTWNFRKPRSGGKFFYAKPRGRGRISFFHTSSEILRDATLFGGDV
jgi:hypothetical protein